MRIKCILILSALILASVPLVMDGNEAAWGIEIEGLDDFLYMDPERTISMDFTMANLGTVLKMFSQQAGLNFIASTEIENKQVNLYLDKVPVEEALERILSANNLTYEIKPESNIFIVKELTVPEKQIMTKVYSLKYATVSASKLNSTLSTDDDSDEESSSSSSTADGGSGIINALKSILSQDGAVIEDTRTNSLIVSDIPSQFPLIELTIAKLDVPVPQILIEAEMLDISKRTGDLLGAKFGDTPVEYFGAQRDYVFPWNQDNLLNKGYEFEDPEYRVGTMSFKGLKFSLQFLRTQTDTKNLARPRILTLNNHTAEIGINTDEAVGIIETEDSDGGDTTTQAERMKTGVSLKVTPQANLVTREIVMAIEPKVIIAVASNLDSDLKFKDPEERASKSILKVRDGDTIVIGGLLRTGQTDIRTSVPGLGNIPLIGAAFRHKDNQIQERELIIFITPHILSDETTPSLARPGEKITREQSVPDEKRQIIENSLSSYEKQSFNNL